MQEYRNKKLKLIPRATVAPWVVKKMVGSTPVLLGTKLPVSYRGSLREHFLEITADVARGPAFAHSIASTVAGRAEAVTVDLGLVLEGEEGDGHLPEQLLGLVRVHHHDTRRAPTRARWERELAQRHR